MSWEKAQREAEKWLATSGVPAHQGIRGQYFDLRDHGDKIAAQGQFRAMILRAAARQLTKRGATASLPE